MRRLLSGCLIAFLASLAGLTGSDSAEANGQACGAGANGSSGYAYAGHQSTTVAHGVRATITPTAAPSVTSGHVAGWVGVGGPAQGANGATLWLQAGIAVMPNTAPMVYAEITRSGKSPEFVPLLEEVRVGESHRVAVLEMSGRPNWWQVWLDGAVVTDPILLPHSSDRWRPIATAESWNGGKQVCNSFAFRFDGVGVAGSTGGSWRPFAPGFRFQDRGYTVTRLSTPPRAPRATAGGAPSPYAFEASSLL